ncbi:MAG: ABC transporter substrate-binding protein, partial [Thermodesulfobacteriota bacterium]
RDAAFIIRQARSMGIESVFIGGDGWDDLMYEYAGDALAGSYFADHWHVDLPDPRSKAFAARYEAGHARRPGSLAALSYDTVHLLADAIRRAGSAAPKAIRNALADTRDFKGITGTITFDENGDPEKPIVMIRFGHDATVFDRFM